jgi:glycosyltransferase involved in cell wall biosynthesis
MTTPAVSVLLAVHNGAPWVSEAVESVLAQTLGEVELIVVDDGSTDATADLLASFRADRVRVEHQARAGLTRSLNRALALARAPLVARLDADDVALPERLGRQREFLDAHPDVGLVGGAAREIDVDGRLVREVWPPTDDVGIRQALIRRNPFVHSSVTMRRDLVGQVGGYDERWPVAQDYDLWMRLSRVTRLANLAEVVTIRRLVPGRVTVERDDDRLRAEARVRWRAVRAGLYPWWAAVYAARPVLALALPLGTRRMLRRMVGREARSEANGSTASR